LKKLLMMSVLGLGISIFSAPLVAHHGYAAYDTDKKVSLKGTVTRWIWSNPHCLLQFDVADNDGRVVHWVAETENPSTMARAGWTEKAIKAGDQVTVDVLQVKNGNPAGRILDVVLPNGQVLAGRINPANEVKPDESAKP
jgi:hypothetical protein